MDTRKIPQPEAMEQQKTDAIVIETSSDELSAKQKWRVLFYFTTRRHAIALALALVFTVAAGVMLPMIAILLGRIFDAFSNFGAGAVTTEQLMHTVSRYCLFLFGLGLVIWVLQSGYFALWLVFGELQAKVARQRLFSELLKRDLGWFETRNDGIPALLPRLQTYVFSILLSINKLVFTHWIKQTDMATSNGNGTTLRISSSEHRHLHNISSGGVQYFMEANPGISYFHSDMCWSHRLHF